MPKILIVDDETQLRSRMKTYLEERRNECREAENGRQALKLLAGEEFDLMILDLHMDGMDGFSCLREMQSLQIQVPVMVYSVSDAIEDKLSCFEYGVYDYVNKTSSLAEVEARIHAILRRAGQSQRERRRILAQGDVKMDLESRDVWLKKEAVPLTKTEFNLLELLVRNSGTVLTRESILHQIWNYNDYGAARLVDVHMKNLRERLGAYGNRIITVRRQGYMFCG